MIRRLQKRLIAISMLSVFTVLAVMIAAVNLAAHFRSEREADQTLAYILENGGVFPRPEETAPHMGRRPTDSESPEAPFYTRYCSVTLDQDGQLVSSHMDRIASLTQESAVSYAGQILASGRVRGTVGDYRFLASRTEDGGTVLFLYAGRQQAQNANILRMSLMAGAVVLLAVFLMLLLLSGRMVRPLAESYEKQRRFITDAGHELRTPLTIINADTELLMMEQEENEWLQDIRRQTTRLSGLTNDLIYLSRMEEERHLQMLEFPLSDVCQEAVSSFQGPATARKLSITARIEPMISMNGDEGEISRLVMILLENAVKYTPENGDIVFTLSRAGKNLEITCSNPSEPLSKEAVKGLFDRFYRADPSRQSKKGGFGIGLSVAQAIVQAHKGRIQAEQKDGRLTFTALLPG